MQEPSAYLFKKEQDRYGRSGAVQTLSCPLCTCTGFVEEQVRDRRSGDTFDLWVYECIVCSHTMAFRRKLERKPHVTTTFA